MSVTWRLAKPSAHQRAEVVLTFKDQFCRLLDKPYLTQYHRRARGPALLFGSEAAPLISVARAERVSKRAETAGALYAVVRSIEDMQHLGL